MGIESSDLEKALAKKGFSLEPGKKDHRWYRFYHRGMATSIRTKISHGPKHTLGPRLVSATWKQMRLRNKNDLSSFVECTLSETKYIQILEEAGIIAASNGED